MSLPPLQFPTPKQPPAPKYQPSTLSVEILRYLQVTKRDLVDGCARNEALLDRFLLVSLCAVADQARLRGHDAAVVSLDFLVATSGQPTRAVERSLSRLHQVGLVVRRDAGFVVGLTPEWVVPS